MKNDNKIIISKNKTFKIKLWAIIFWIFIWYITNKILDNKILLVSPVEVLFNTIKLSKTIDFWLIILNSLVKISLGFFIALVFGILLAALSSKFCFIKDLLLPLIYTIKSIPIASFIILVLIWISSENLSIFMAFITVFPVIYINIFEGVKSINKEILEMAHIFNISKKRKIRYIYLSHLIPYFKSACSIGLGLAWKAGIAAEVIAIPNKSIGEKLYTSKIYINTIDLFSWTLIIVLVSIAFEKIILFLIDISQKKLLKI